MKKNNLSLVIVNNSGVLSVMVSGHSIIDMAPSRAKEFIVYAGGDNERMMTLKEGQSVGASFGEGKPRIEVTASKVIVQYRDNILYTIPVKKSWVADKIGVYF